MGELVTIIVPVYNIRAYLEQCIDSLLFQTHSTLEIIIVDDGSTDGSGEICDSYAAHEDRIIVVHQKNSGVSSARNRALEEVRGKYVMFVDGDDVLPIDSIETMLGALIRSGVDCVIGQVENFSQTINYRDAQEQPVTIMDSDEALCDMLYEKSINGGPFPKLYLFDSVKSVKFPEDIKYAEDLEYNYFSIGSSSSVALLDKVVYYYRLRDDGAMGRTFSIDRMSGLTATGDILRDSIDRPRVEDAAKSRHFMEALYIGMLIRDTNLFRLEYQRCTSIMKLYGSSVALNGNVKMKHRIFAAIACLSPALLFKMFSVKSALNSVKKGV